MWLALVVSAAVAAQAPAPQDRARAAERAKERIRALQREAEALASQQSRLLVDLRKLEIDRQLRSEELSQAEKDLAETEHALKVSAHRATELQKTAEAERPEIESRLVQLYKLGRAGHWRLLLDVEDLRSMGRAYRTAAALTRIDRERVQAHQRTLEALVRERKALEARAVQLTTLREQARRARAAVERTATARTALVDAIDVRRDLNAQMTSELQAAQQRLQASVNNLESGGEPVALPLRPFQGALPWPAAGRITSSFGRQTSSRFGTAIVKNGIEIAIGEGQPVRAVHEGTVAFADPFTGYGNLVIIDHGDRAFSLYGHLEALQVSKGQRVESGAALGLSGRDPSGNPALYFELRVDGKPVDPLQWLKKGNP